MIILKHVSKALSRCRWQRERRAVARKDTFKSLITFDLSNFFDLN